MSDFTARPARLGPEDDPVRLDAVLTGLFGDLTPVPVEAPTLFDEVSS